MNKVNQYRIINNNFKNNIIHNKAIIIIICNKFNGKIIYNKMIRNKMIRNKNSVTGIIKNHIKKEKVLVIKNNLIKIIDKRIKLKKNINII